MTSYHDELKASSPPSKLSMTERIVLGAVIRSATVGRIVGLTGLNEPTVLDTLRGLAQLTPPLASERDGLWTAELEAIRAFDAP
jgi:hypothetical protein